MILALFKAQGHSMEPIVKNGSFFIISNIPYKLNNPKVNHMIVFRSREKMIVKKIVKIEKEKYFIEGENLLDNMNFGPIKKNDILGKVLWIF